MIDLCVFGFAIVVLRNLLVQNLIPKAKFSRTLSWFVVGEQRD